MVLRTWLPFALCLTSPSIRLWWAFATGKQSHTGKRVRETGKVIVTVPGESLAGAVMACGASTGAETDKVAANNIEMMAVEGSDIQIPADTRLAMV
ncbi:protein/domain typically associated with flavoprotein oxygenases, DIM6/NTAB family [human gut metagenome]|uniref:Protein/domain typically associated with flavoprotein oxygenases, DIM6/NTAB family n=1 Tax=human gut metagenome TaxID=408170 RepID=K1T6V6_9ZZZZ